MENIVKTSSHDSTNGFLASVKIAADYNQDLTKRFKPLLHYYKYITVHEGSTDGGDGLDLRLVCLMKCPRKNNHWRKQIVDQDSALLGFSEWREIKINLDKENSTICKFTGVDDPQYILVSDSLHRFALGAVDAFTHSSAVLEQLKALEEPIIYLNGI